MNNEQFTKLAIEYKSLQEMKSALDLQQQGIRKQMLQLMKESNMDDYSYSGAKATVIRTERQMYIKKKLISKFGEENLKDCMKVINTESVRINYKEVE